MFSKNVTNIDICLNSSVITDRILAKILTTTIECLIYMKNQIPFPFFTFQEMVNKIKGFDAKNDEKDWNNFLLSKKRSTAVDTFDNLNLLLKVLVLFLVELIIGSYLVLFYLFAQNIIRQFETHEISQALILFGSTCHTPKEAFLIKLPEVMKNHFSVNHMSTLPSVARNVAM